MYDHQKKTVYTKNQIALSGGKRINWPNNQTNRWSEIWPFNNKKWIEWLAIEDGEWRGVCLAMDGNALDECNGKVGLAQLRILRTCLFCRLSIYIKKLLPTDI